eukprot:Gregarina_sp_Poly_1__928@NODE_1223_length_4730_cov_85_138109_g828_i1_p7_GENE_NODE_1223_length_4730_cov_85_138109_g828_i1NODE_1223_length_4730_cov_85_138109_g828_i1_p7_ORF_typecomplete_len116_score2_25Serglycin/PF04360_12/0_013_NODE_1223_length_4730_cov_85_138109_g828_i114741821
MSIILVWITHTENSFRVPTFLTRELRCHTLSWEQFWINCRPDLKAFSCISREGDICHNNTGAKYQRRLTPRQVEAVKFACSRHVGSLHEISNIKSEMDETGNNRIGIWSRHGSWG